jgi:hypothetical protein
MALISYKRRFFTWWNPTSEDVTRWALGKAKPFMSENWKAMDFLWTGRLFLFLFFCIFEFL